MDILCSDFGVFAKRQFPLVVDNCVNLEPDLRFFRL
jgi:hypothetical protein